MHFLLYIYFRKMWSHAVSMGSSLLLDFSFYCSFGKKVYDFCCSFYFLKSQSRVLCPKWEQITTWNPQENPLLPFWENGKLSWMRWFQFSLLKNYLIFRFGNKQTECLHWGFVCSSSSLPLAVPVSSVGCLLPRVFLDIQMMWTAKEQGSPPSPAVLLILWQMHDRHSPVLPTAQEGLVISLNSWDLNRESFSKC